MINTNELRHNLRYTANKNRVKAIQLIEVIEDYQDLMIKLADNSSNSNKLKSFTIIINRYVTALYLLSNKVL
ncbi:MAG: hypothetical protein DRO67_00670 [Candidatus Asgardarchaeum californiense]|nr:MAG: hypothetical protein DRO67_00670 [Candidatus Asgardarchaeum californiense]